MLTIGNLKQTTAFFFKFDSLFTNLLPDDNELCLCLGEAAVNIQPAAKQP